MIRLVTEWSTDDPQLADMLRGMNSEPDPVLRLELESVLHMWQAMKATRDAERIRCQRSRRGRKSNV